MFPILHGRHNLVTKGWFFPGHGTVVRSGLSLYVRGYRRNAEAVTIPGGAVHAGDTVLDLHFPVPSLDLTRALSVTLRLKSPSGRVVDLPAATMDAHTAIYPVASGDLVEPGTWRYQISLLFRSGTFYHLDAGKFRVKANILGVD